MKKTYIMPQISLFAVNTKCAILAGSGPNDVTLSTDNVMGSGDSFGSRRGGSVWADDDED